jgi:hypothetical protein
MLLRCWRAEGEGEMITNVLPPIFTIETGGTPTLVFEAKNLREAHEQWLKSDLAEAKSNGVPLWDGKAKLRARMASPDESAMLAEAKNSGEPSDGLMLVHLVELDGEATNQDSVDPGDFLSCQTLTGGFRASPLECPASGSAAGASLLGRLSDTGRHGKRILRAR